MIFVWQFMYLVVEMNVRRFYYDYYVFSLKLNGKQNMFVAQRFVIFAPRMRNISTRALRTLYKWQSVCVYVIVYPIYLCAVNLLHRVIVIFLTRLCE